MILKHLSYISPSRPAAIVTFSEGLNVVHGASNTGKSFIVTSIDYMLGGTGLRRQIPESEPYNQILLCIHHAGEDITISRSPKGGGAMIYTGIFVDKIPSSVEPTMELTPGKFREYLNSALGLEGIALRKNAKNETKALTIRTLLPLFIAGESRIYSEQSPYLGENRTDKTYERSRLRFLVTGADDSKLVADEKDNVRVSRQSKLEVLEELKIRKQAQLVALRPNDEPIEEFEDQKERLSDSLEAASRLLENDEGSYREMARMYRSASQRYQASLNRRDELDSMIERFALLDEQYSSDVERLEANLEAGGFFRLLPDKDCPLCGSKAKERAALDHAHADIEQIITATRAELFKTVVNQLDLRKLISELANEQIALSGKLKEQDETVDNLGKQTRALSIPMRSQQGRFKELFSEMTEVENVIGLFDEVREFEDMIKSLERERQSADSGPEAADLPLRAIDEVSKNVENLLTEWALENEARVYFDAKDDDFVINGKRRQDNGKGYRAISYAAALLALQMKARTEDAPEPGFALLDTPLLAYEPPIEGEQDEQDEAIASSATNQLFLESLAKLSGQHIVLENERALPDKLPSETHSIVFTGKSGVGRFGFFPVDHERS